VLFKNYIFKFKFFPALIFAITFCGFIVLGFWQIDRADQKNALNSNYTDRQQEAAKNQAFYGERLSLKVHL
jgi:cytochrome oxidase assembly protein ShyY1